MDYRINNFLMKLDLFDYPKILKDRFLKNPVEKENEKKRYNFYSGIIENGGLCFDVGASYGNRTEIFLQLGAKVVAVEPQFYPARYLKRKFKDKIILIEKALGSSPGKSTMYVTSASSLSSMSEEWVNEVKKNRFDNISWDEKKEVETTTLDELIGRYGKPDFCKIDVEGYELEVLKGLTSPISLISFEYTIPEFMDKAIACINYLSSLGEVVCNYSPGETMQFALPDWIEPSEFIKIFRQLPGQNIIDGDIYIKFITE